MRNDIKWQKSQAFALRIIKLYKYLNNDKNEYVISKQILRSGTSIGANIVESEFSESTSDFIHKLTISQKETAETLYWLDLLEKSEYLEKKLFDSLYSDCEEIMKILTAIIIKTKKKKEEKKENKGLRVKS